MSGFHYFLKGLNLIFKPGMRRYLYLPIFLNLILLIVLGYFGIHGIEAITAHFAGSLPHWLHFLESIATVILSLAFIALLVFSFTTLASIIGAPFYSVLCEAVLQQEDHKAPEESLFALIKDMPRLIGRELIKLRYSIVRVIILMILMFIPGLNLIISILWFLFNCWMQAIQYIDYPMDLFKHHFNHTLSATRKKPFTAMGFGLICFVCTMIPLLNLIAIPAAVAGGTLLWSDQIKPLLDKN
ncbi:sulfate transporter CysZ [Piscirickettsia litoralis]|uniref:Cysteine biosynthesis protein CysZ n=1 Tax=Piscirickettsia litoralis TaxID=1891921 RepID=A0ABX3A0E2_9GAMM|nr:sulfate transporter CysZ [Piscirickettsia litoralis]ODN42253.1 cysteine biosynthesis protein CysZ [Piscirickettsia litoralis]